MSDLQPIQDGLNPTVAPTPVETPVDTTTETVADTEASAIPSVKHPIEDGTYLANVTFKEGNVTLSLPSQTNIKTVKMLENISNYDETNTNAAEWKQAITDGLSCNTLENILVDTVNDKDSRFLQTIEVNGKKLSAKPPVSKSISNEDLKGERGVLKALSQLGLGTPFTVPLYHSGIWLTFKAPTEGYLLELNRQFISDKITFGRSSYGLAYSNTSCYTIDRLVNAALDHLHTATIDTATISRTELLELLSTNDIYHVIWGFAATIYPKGIQYQRACIADPDNCNYVLKAVIDVQKFQYTNDLALTEEQKVFMSSRQPRSKTVESVKLYQASLMRSANRQVTVIGDNGVGLTFNLKTPSISEYIEAGYRWVNSVVSDVESAIAEMPKEAREKHLIRRGQATAMRNYVHYVQSVELEDNNVITDTDTIEKLMDSISTDDSLRENFTKEVIKYINSSTISIIGIPAYDCPNCGKENKSDHQFPNLSEIIPLDVVQLFFQQHGQRMLRLRTR
jgi:hypothetical protein